MKIFNYEITGFVENDWEQLNFLLDKSINYNWYDFNILVLGWEIFHRKKVSDLSESMAKFIKKFKLDYDLSVQVRFGMLGIVFNIIVERKVLWKL